MKNYPKIKIYNNPDSWKIVLFYKPNSGTIIKAKNESLKGTFKDTWDEKSFEDYNNNITINPKNELYTTTRELINKYADILLKSKDYDDQKEEIEAIIKALNLLIKLKQ